MTRESGVQTVVMFWERCDICGRHKPTRTCWLHPERNVCAYCCVFCIERGHCPNPVWYPEIKRVEVAVEVEERPAPVAVSKVEVRKVERVEEEEERRRLEERRRRLKQLEELLKRLSGEA